MIKKFKKTASDVLLKIKNKAGSTYSFLKEKISHTQKKEPSSQRPMAETKKEFHEILSTPFDPALRPKLHQAFKITAIVLTSWSVGKTVGVFMGGTKKPNPPLSSSQNLTARNNSFFTFFKPMEKNNLFHVKNSIRSQGKKILVQQIDHRIKCLESKRKSKLPIKLISTVVLQNSKKSVATIKSKGKVKFVRTGETIDSLAKLGHIDRLRIVFKNLKNGNCEYVQLVDKSHKTYPFTIVGGEEGKNLLKKQTMEGISNDGHSYQISKKLLNQKLSDLSKVLTEAKATGLKNPDGTMSFKITEIVPGSIFDHLGIKNGDKIKRIDGKKIKNMNEVMNLFGQIKDIDQLQLSISREGKGERILDYSFSN